MPRISIMEWFKNGEVFYSTFYITAITFVVFLAWATGATLLGMAVLFIVAGVVLIRQQDITPLLPIIVLFYFCVSHHMQINIFFWVTLAIMLVAIIFFIAALVIHAKRYKVPYKKTRTMYAMIVMCFAGVLGGIFAVTATRYFVDLALNIVIGFFLLLVYFFIVRYLKPKTDIKRYISISYVALGMLMVLQLFYYYVEIHFAHGNIDSIIDQKIIELGWGISNSVGVMLMISIPFTLYLSQKYKNGYLFFILSALEFIAMIMTFSRGALLFTLFIYPALVVYAIYKSKSVKRYLLCIGVFFVIFVVAFLSKVDFFIGVIENMINRGFTDAGRFSLYLEAWKTFCRYPVFGTGCGWKSPGLEQLIVDLFTGNIGPGYFNYFITLYHSTFLQIMVNYGLIGIGLYIYHYVIRYKILFEVKSEFNVYVLGMFLLYDLYGVIDSYALIPTFLIHIILMMCIVEHTNSRQCEENGFNYFLSVYPRQKQELGLRIKLRKKIKTKGIQS